VKFDIDVYAVPLRLFYDHAIAAFHRLHRFVVRETFRLVEPVGGCDVWAACKFGPGDRLKHIGNTENGTVFAREGIGGVDLREGNAVTLHYVSHLDRILNKGDVWEVA
jgi:hypothetical protein